jgi:hypothetical protein
MSKNTTLKVNQIIAVEFLDHVQDWPKPLRFMVYGRLISITSESITVETWGYANKRSKRDNNCTNYTIIRSAIKKITQLTPK